MIKTSSLIDFENALKLLDEKLGLANKKIEIKAIGGFVMMYYGLRDNGYTIDIDSLTVKYDHSIESIIKEVGNELGIDEDWLNTDCAELDGFLNILSEQINWIPTKYSFKNIDLKIADIIGIVRSKAKAINDGGIVPRSTDKKDLLSSLRYLGIYCIDDIESNKELDFIYTDYKMCFKFLNDIKKW